MRSARRAVATCGSCANARARKTRLRSPPESSWIGRRASSMRSNRSSAGVRDLQNHGGSRNEMLRDEALAPSAQSRARLKRKGDQVSCATIASAARSHGDRIRPADVPQALPCRSTDAPRSSDSWSSVDLPAPFGPTIANRSQRELRSIPPCSTARSPYPAVRLLARIATAAASERRFARTAVRVTVVHDALRLAHYSASDLRPSRRST